jgi:hypothetical protein
MIIDKEIANFFWHGNPLSLYEISCINSFVKNNWHVRLWTFGNIVAPPNVEICDAREFFNESDIKTFIQKKKVGCIAAFSDAFRYNLLSKHNGWWFDTDCVCLKDQIEFSKLKKDRRIIAGYERPDMVAVGVLYFNDIMLADQAVIMLNQILHARNRKVGWGEIGPRLITGLVNNFNLQKDILPGSYFYPLTPKQALDALSPEKLELVENKCKDSFVYHYWSEMISRANIDKSILPPKDSFLYNKFTE